MLCRVADSLFWMSRYVERAENTARLVDVNLQLLLDSEGLNSVPVEDFWANLLLSTGEHAFFLKLYQQLNTQNIMDFFTFNPQNPSSILSCVISARENARMIRDQISDEMWEVVNRMYHSLRTSAHLPVSDSGIYDLYKQVKEGSSLFVGVTESTYTHQVGYEFIRAGRSLERAEKTGRIIGSKQHLMELEWNHPSSIANWGSVLRACSASSAYHQTHKMQVKPVNVISLLISSRVFPRAMLYSLLDLQAAVHSVSGCPVTHYSNEVERLVGRLISDLNYTSTAEIVEMGLGNFLSSTLKQIDRIALEFSQKYMFFPVVDPASEAA